MSDEIWETADRRYGYGYQGKAVTITEFTGRTFGYAGSDHNHTQPHAVKWVDNSGNIDEYFYDANGNMESGGDREFEWDEENHLKEGSFRGDAVSFVYDGDGELVRKTASGQTTVYAGTHYDYHLDSDVRRRYYFFGGHRVAMRTGATPYFLHSDHLGSTSLATDANGNVVSDSLIRYFPYGGSRMGSEADAPTDYLFTGQRREQNLGGLLHMGARFYHPGLGRWISADRIVPDPANPQSLNRYSYVLGNPLKYTDPSGHGACSGDDYDPACEEDLHPVVWYIYWEMVTNAQSDMMNRLVSLNESSFGAAWGEVPHWTPGAGEGPNAAAVAGMATETLAMGLFGSMVRQKGPWDPKPDIGEAYGYFQQLGDTWYYYYDVWGNVMFGYLGAAAGFAESDLFAGAGAEQIGSDLGYTGIHQDLSYLPRQRIPGVDGLAAFDHPEDRVGSQIGTDLWSTYGLNLTPMALQLMVTAQGEALSRQSSP